MIVDEIELMRRLKDVEELPPEVSDQAKLVLQAAIAADDCTQAVGLEDDRPRSGRRVRSGPKRRSRRLAAFAAGGLALVVGGGIAAAAVLPGAPTPQQATTIYQRYYPDNGAGHTPGTRPTLNSEVVLCNYQGVASFPAYIRDHGNDNENFASNAALTVPLTPQLLVDACAQSRVSSDTVPSSTPAVLCVAREQGVADDDEPPGWPIVVLGDATCASAGDAPAPTDLLAQVNQRRNLEADVDAVPQSCPTETQTLTWVHQQLAQLRTRMPLQVVNQPPGGICWLPSVHWEGPVGTPPFVEVAPSQSTP